MKKFLCTMLVCVIAAISFVCIGCDRSPGGLIRIHIRAHSDSPADQAVKLLVRDSVINYLTPKLENAADKGDAYKIMSDGISKIDAVARSVLTQKGFEYSAASRMTNEYFPARVYDGTVFDSGYYDALIIDLGSAEGDNWWCVAYPPLCFYGSDSVEYTSLILEWFT